MKITPADKKHTKFSGGDVTALQQRIVNGLDDDEGERNYAAEENGSGQPQTACTREPRGDRSRAPDRREARLKDSGPPIHRREKTRREVVARLKRRSMLDELNEERRPKKNPAAKDCKHFSYASNHLSA